MSKTQAPPPDNKAPSPVTDTGADPLVQALNARIAALEQKLAEVTKTPAPSVSEAATADEEFIVRFAKLFESARASGVEPLKVLGASYKRKGLAVLDGVLGALGEDNKKKG